MTQINIKRVYETPSSNDGYRVLVDRLWPRGMKREYLKYDYWAKELTPSNDLRKWFHADVEKRWGQSFLFYHFTKSIPLMFGQLFGIIQQLIFKIFW